MKEKPHQTRRETSPKQKASQSDLDYRALEAENLRLHREIAKLKAQHVSELNRRVVELETPAEDESEALKKARDWLAKRRESNPPIA